MAEILIAIVALSTTFAVPALLILIYLRLRDLSKKSEQEDPAQ